MKKNILYAVSALMASITVGQFANASAFDNGEFQFNKKELSDLSKIIFATTFEATELRKLHQVDEGILYDEQIVLANSEGLMGKKVTGCTPSATNGIELSEKVWQPVKEDFRLEHCSADVNNQDKLIQQMTQMNDDFYKIFEGSQNKLGQFLIASLLERFNEEIMRKIWFNDKAIATVANGGNLTNGTDIGFFNSFDGLFKQFFSDANLNTKYRVTIAKNAGSTYDAQMLEDQEGYEILRAVYMKADMRLRTNPNALFYVTQTVYDAYLGYLETVTKTGAGSIEITENGKTLVKYRGIEVVPIHVWDRVIGKYFDNGTKQVMPNRAVLSTPQNLRVGTLSETDFHKLKAYFVDYHNLNVIDGIYSIDAKIIEDYMVVMAY